MTSSVSEKCSFQKLEGIDEDSPANWQAISSAPPPETPVESLEFLARSWSISGIELAKAISTTLSHSRDNMSVVSVADAVEMECARPAASKEPVRMLLLHFHPHSSLYIISNRIHDYLLKRKCSWCY